MMLIISISTFVASALNLAVLDSGFEKFFIPSLLDFFVDGEEGGGGGMSCYFLHGACLQEMPEEGLVSLLKQSSSFCTR